MLQKHAAAVTSLAFTPNGFLIASGAQDGSIRLWDLIDDAERAVLDEGNNATPVGSLTFSPDETLLAAAGGSTIRVWNLDSGEVQATLETSIAEITSLSFRPDGMALIYGGSDPAVWVWDLANDNQVLLEGLVGGIVALAIPRSGEIIASADAGTLRLWDAATGANLADLMSPANSLAFRPDGKLLATGGDTGGVVVWGTTAEGGSAETVAAPESAGTTTDSTTTDTAASGTSASSSGCIITAPGNVNLRTGAGTDFELAGTLAAGQTADVDGQATGSDGQVWWRLGEGVWVRSDVVDEAGDCEVVAVVQG
jgi:WD40 repeat protein